MFNKLTSILWKVFFVIMMLLLFIFLLFHLVSKLFLSPRRYRRLTWQVARVWGWFTMVSTGTRVKVSGRENIPLEGPICFMGNHQSYFDIPTLLGFAGCPMGFIAKQELARVPVLKQWMVQLPSFFLDRDNARQAIKVFQAAAKVMKEGHPMVIFPEGLRAERGKVADFHLGSLKLAQMAGATIVPFALDGTWRMLEIDGNIHAARVNFTILPPVRPGDPIYDDKIALAAHLKSSIEACLTD
ncbi:MAG TPA: lysophospholipid acyltransferase family protein [Candidatus Syntrophosphaera sp.]|jgi:1-acyl-sn-glycerol-3-phosphate acyltransferase|nr:lysophospholipid acyltransferase family protein [Candidatus Syntrophosphaera sp.]HOH47945.1 lysophospholipid acyltransferase family protein [Candidatus Syntrophosphaera sp.]HPW38052.1 lysophospholipid acyltransferase family protein [Candidatus Syntrophosphaera sp.]HQC46493.1 lysophospholipid acyltransferase family protein [Candidatus Syntrophosphaera sp.]